MRVAILFTVLLMIGPFMRGQNLIPNGSFEEMRNLPIKPNPKNSFQYEPHSGYRPFQHNLNYWFAATNTTPDLRIKSKEDLQACKKRFIECDEPKSGNYCVGIITYMKNKTVETYREYIQIKFSSSLEEETKTFVEFWVCKERQAKLVSNNIGCYFSEKKILAGDEAVILVEPMINHKQLVNTDKKEWVKVSGEFIAQKGYNFLTIGNFFSNEKTKVKEYENYKGSSYIPPYAYYLVDDVKVWQKELNEIKFEEQEVVTNEFAISNDIEFEGKKVVADLAVILNNIKFDYNKSSLMDESKISLHRLLDLMNENRQMKMVIMGHTDNNGNSEYNQRLSEKRAQTVMEYLALSGISRERLSYIGYGDKHPIVNNTSEKNRQQNRRVEFKLVND